MQQTMAGVLTVKQAEEFGILGSAEGLIRESPDKPWKLLTPAERPTVIKTDPVEKAQIDPVDKEPTMAEAKPHNLSLHRALSHLNKGGLHRALGVPEGEKIPADKLESAKNSDNPHIRKMAQFAGTMENFHHGK